MITGLSVLGLLAVVAFLLYDRARERRHASHVNPDLQALVELCDRLCQRLQAPNAAVLEHDARLPRTEEYAPPAVPPDDDDAFWMSRDKLADLLMQHETSTDGHN